MNSSGRQSASSGLEDVNAIYHIHFSDIGVFLHQYDRVISDIEFSYGPNIVQLDMLILPVTQTPD